jgi:hypothetical protein
VPTAWPHLVLHVNHQPPAAMKPILRFVVCLATSAITPLSAQVTIHEFQANPTEKILKWDANGIPTAGSGTVWYDTSFHDALWPSGNQPFGQSAGGLATDLTAQMQGKAFSLYLRKTFTADNAQATSAAMLRLSIEYDDGFVAYLNGVEIARKNLGPKNHFIYALQRSYNPAVTTGAVGIDIGPCNQYLIEGTNVLAIQVHNYDLGGDLKVNASLGTAGAAETITGASVDFNSSTGASETFRIVNGGAPTTTTSGTANNWLTMASDPTATGPWDTLQIITTETTNGGVGDGGYLLYDITQLGANGTTASMSGPGADLGTGWLEGNITQEMLENTWVSFRYKTSPGSLFGLTLLPEAGEVTSTITGAPLLGASTAPQHPQFLFNGPGGGRTYTTDASGIGSTEDAGTRWYDYRIWCASNLANGQWTATEAASEPSPNGGTNGVFRYRVTQVPTKIDLAGDQWFGMHINSARFDFWPRGHVTADDLARTRIRFRYRVTTGNNFNFRLEPDGGSYHQRLELGNLSSAGEWATYDGTLGSWSNASAWLAHINAGNTTPTDENFGGYLGGQFVISCTSIHGIAPGDGIELDDITLWYDTSLPAEQITRRDYSDNNGGIRTFTIDSAGSYSDLATGTLNHAYQFFSAPDLRDGQMRITEDAQTASPDTTTGFGVLKFTWTDAATVTPGGQDWWGWSTRRFDSPGWTDQAVTENTLERSRVKFAMKAPVGKSIRVRLELDGLGHDERLDFGSFLGTGNWETHDLSCASAGNLPAFLTGINAAAGRVNDMRFTFGSADAIDSYDTGDTWFIDDLSITYTHREPVGTQVAKTFHGTPGPGITYTIDSTGLSNSSGSVAGVNAVFSSSPALRNGAFSLNENISDPEGSGDGNGPGFLRLVTTTVPTTITPGDHDWAVTTTPYSVPEWPQGHVTYYDLMHTRVKMRLRIPAGRGIRLRIEPDGYGTAQACDMGVLTGDGTWQNYERPLSQGTNLDAFLSTVKSNALGNHLKLSFGNDGPPAGYANGDAFDFDNIELCYEGYGTGDSASLDFEDATGGMRHHRRIDSTTTSVTYRGDFTQDSNVVANVTSFAGIEIGMRPTVSTIPAGTTITAIDAVARTLTLSANATSSSTQQAMTFGCVRHYSSASSDPAATGLSITATEDNTPGAGHGNSNGHLRVNIHNPASAGDWMSVSMRDIHFHNLRAGEVTEADLDATSLDFAVHIPIGIAWTFWLEPEGGGYDQRLDLTTIMGTGSWHEVSIPLIDRNNTRANFIDSLHLNGSTTCRLVFSTSPQHAPGVALRLDDVRVSTWREYRVNLASLGNTTAFLNHLNANSLTTLLPVFTKQSGAAIGGSTLGIDNFAITYTGPPAASISTLIGGGTGGGAWKYFVGHHEPSGVVVDTKLVTNPFPVPAGKDEDYEDPHETRGWVELKNGGASPYDLTGHSLTDDNSKPALWTFPAGTSIPANGYLLVICDNRIEANGPTADYLHSSIELNRDGGTLSLYQGTTRLDTVTYPGGQTPHQSYGRDATGTQWVFLDHITPLAANIGTEMTAKCVSPGVFAADGTTPLTGDFYDTAQTVTLSSATAGTTIRYTLDGSDPVETSTEYTGPLTINAIDEKTGTVLRARAFKDGFLPSATATRTFLIAQNAAIKTLPAFVMTGDNHRVWYDDMGILTIQGGTYDEEGIWHPNGPESYNIPNLSSDPAERPATFEYMHAGTTPGFNITAGVRLSASDWSVVRARYESPYDSPWNPWVATQKPNFNIFFRGAYGSGKLAYPLFPGYDVVRFDHLRLRAGKNDIANPHITDELCRRIFTGMGNEGITGTWCTLYVNGVFKGYYNLCERVREPFFQEHYGSSTAWDVIYNGLPENGTREAFDTLLYTDLARDLTIQANYDIVKSKIDIKNACDYYLMKIYAAMWDWPENNWALARERSTGANSIFRFADWDSEGGFNAVGYTGKNVDYDTIGIDLKNNHTEVGRIFNRLQTSPEFRLALADRIQKHFFNGGVLDDRASVNPNFWLKSTKDELKALVSPIMQYVIGESFEESWFTTWTDESTGRRSQLFGNGPASFITHGYWPTTTAATLSLPAGIIPYGSTLTITANQGTIYYTIDGSDPRLPGGGIHSEALVYTGTITFNTSGTIRVRVWNEGQWSPLNEASYIIDPDDPAIGNLVIAELMYNGAPPTTAEAALGYNVDSFDYCRVMNIGNHPVSTAGLSFYGITCALPLTGGNVPYVEPGESFLVVKDINGFRYRYGNGYDHMISAAYSANFSNGGEQVKLIYTPPAGGPAVTIVNFTYSDAPPWPKAADGYGASLLLINPTSNPDPNVNPDPTIPLNWIASCGVGGQPGGVPLTTTWSTWGSLAFPAADLASIKAPTADPDGDGIRNDLEYTFGTSPKLADPPHRVLPQGIIVTDGDERYLSLKCRVNPAAIDASITVETSGTLASDSWLSGPGHTVSFGTPIQEADGSRTSTVRDAIPMSAANPPRRFLRMKVSLPE